MEVVAVFHSPFGSKFGIPRQSGLVDSLPGEVRLEGRFRSPDALRGLEKFDYVWLIWGFSANETGGEFKATVRPPRLGGNERVGVFASRSPFRPNGLALSCVRLAKVDFERCILHVSGADLMDGTPVYDIKPYVPYCDSHPDAAAGFVDENSWTELEVVVPEALASQLEAAFGASGLSALRQVLALDPRPRAAGDPSKVFAMSFMGCDVRFRVEGNVLTVLDACQVSCK